jgi:large subunit ribosomal protein L17e
MREIGQAIKGMTLEKAISYLGDVLQFKQAIPFLRYDDGGRHAQAKCNAGFGGKNVPGDKVKWPQKATKVVLGMLNNCKANAEFDRIDVAELIVQHVQANQAPKMRRRTYRAHGRIGPYQAKPAHFEVICAKKGTLVAKPAEPEGLKAIPTRKQLAQKRFKLKVGGGKKA